MFLKNLFIVSGRTSPEIYDLLRTPLNSLFIKRLIGHKYFMRSPTTY
jgi:hypothetical protein